MVDDGWNTSFLWDGLCSDATLVLGSVHKSLLFQVGQTISKTSTFSNIAKGSMPERHRVATTVSRQITIRNLSQRRKSTPAISKMMGFSPPEFHSWMLHVWIELLLDEKMEHVCRGNDGKWHWYIFPNAMGREAWKTRPHVRGEYRVSSWKLVDKDRYIYRGDEKSMY